MKNNIRTQSLGCILIDHSLSLLIAQHHFLIKVSPESHTLTGQHIKQNGFAPGSVDFIPATERICKVVSLVSY